MTPGTIGSGIQVRGRLSGSGDLMVHGRVEGTIALPAHVLVQPDGVVVADIESQEITVRGKMSGNATATERVSLSSDSTLAGDLRAP